MQLPHYACNPQPSQAQQLPSPEHPIHPRVFQFAVAVVQEDSQVCDVHGGTDGADDVG